MLKAHNQQRYQPIRSQCTLSFLPHENIRKPYGRFLMFSGGRERVHWECMRLKKELNQQVFNNICKQLLQSAKCFFLFVKSASVRQFYSQLAQWRQTVFRDSPGKVSHHFKSLSRNGKLLDVQNKVLLNLLNLTISAKNPELPITVEALINRSSKKWVALINGKIFYTFKIQVKFLYKGVQRRNSNQRTL